MNNSSDLKAWSDVETVDTISLSSLSINSCVNNPEQVNQVENNNPVYLPPELMEKIICYLDGRTLLKFKELSNTCNDITNNALRYNKIWRRICMEELPQKYLIDLVTKQVPKYIPLNLISEFHYEHIYKNWLEWQTPVFKLSKIGQHHFLGLDGVVKIICHKHDVMIVFSNFMYLFSLTKDQMTGSYFIRNSDSELCKHNSIVVLNPRPQTNEDTGEDNVFIDCDIKYSNVCPLHNTVRKIHDGNRREHYTGKLIDVYMNLYTNICCWVRETWYEWHSHSEPKNVINGHLCPHLSYLLYTSIIHGLIISRNRTNSILIHGIFKDSCIMVNPWLKTKYSGATAVYMHTNILFIGTLNGYLLAYRLHSMDDLINLKDKNMMFEMKMDIGQIIMLDIMDFEDVKAIIVASTLSVVWIKID
ncbi:uncharacterized protein LOC112600282 [Melanaphis sacchari]|uniref:uncharacterized protein LOC112600282 n=1 Tax=Melanaphis sacchari TaxID=742174 RepID=UPI000DC13B8D|nr:uncharacterized protein LOC112600282 [Melanaphis sacchari]